MKQVLANISTSKKDAAFFVFLSVGVCGAAIYYDAYEVFHRFLAEHEDWEIDEVMVALLYLGVSGYIYAIRRLIELKRETRDKTLAESRARWISYHDFLTKLPNRRFLEERVPDLLKSSFGHSEYMVFAIDLDGFKRVNDLIGHDGGDQLLVNVAARLTELLPETILVRLGGDEFLAVSPTIHCDQIDDFCDRVISALGDPMKISGIHTEVGASLGYARFPNDGLSLKDVIHCADAALYEAKKRGRNTYLGFTTQMSEQLSLRAEIEGQFREALGRRQIRPHYQPLIDLNTGKLRGFEALARWDSDKFGPVSPEVFVAMAEDIGLILELSEVLLREACKDALEWPSDVILAFNISPSMVIDRLLGFRIIRILSEVGLPPHRLEIEITESALIKDVDVALAVIHELRATGIRIALDDFGTGYSSLSQLSKLTFDKIKIDRSFIAALETDAKQMKIVKTMIALGRGLDISITAEGIEEPSQLAILKELGCGYGQGYLFGRAVPAGEALTLANSNPEKIEEYARKGA
ncbi:MAG: EAL domain-containing protein [Rhodobacteraceae bacterium]|nr:EAL domain-containing protein [Paracoccaceae bacterium]